MLQNLTSGPVPGLVFRSGMRAGEIYYLNSNLVTIGAETGNDILIREPGIASQHAFIRSQYVNDKKFYSIYDISSTDGVTVNGRAVSMRGMLTHGDRIAIGTVSLEFITPSQ